MVKEVRTRDILKHIKREAGVKSISPETIGQVREKFSGFIAKKSIAERLNTDINKVGMVLGVLDEKPSQRRREILGNLYKSKPPTNALSVKGAGHISSAYNVISVLHELGLVYKEEGKRKSTPNGIISTPSRITTIDKKKMKQIWPDIEKWAKGKITNESPVKKTRAKHGEKLSQALQIIGVKSVDELTEKHLREIENLSSIDFAIRKWKKPGNLANLKRELRKHIKRNKLSTTTNNSQDLE
ncbi:MAG: hypothetical protein J7L23_04090 [Candidatus Diapherotrites archaeon]|nr:hypothetical protein [Candidatus Diapherotrites archaeon]